jgi:hypothetical protein
MKRYRPELSLVIVMLAVFALVCHWQAPGRRLTKADVDDYARRIAAGADIPESEKADIVAHLRSWGEADDGKPVFMLNLMRYYDTARSMPGRPDIAGRPRDLNDHYEAVAIPKLLKLGAYPLFAGEPEGVRPGAQPSTNILGFDDPLENWGRVLVVRYPDRRAFFELLSDPDYIKVLPYKLAALKVVLVPMHDELVIPDVRWVAGVLLLAVLALVACVRANRRRRAAPGAASLSGLEARSDERERAIQ